MTISLKSILTIILVMIFTSIFIPSLIRNLPVFLIIVSLAGVVFLSQIKSEVIHDKVFKLILIFSAVGILYLIASFAIQGWTQHYRFDIKHIVRQSYFVIMFPLFVVTGVSIYRVFNGSFHYYLGRLGLYFFIIILSADILSALILGDNAFRVENGYAHFLDKGLIWLFVCIPYFYCVAYGIKKHAFFVFLNLFFILDVVAGYGVMFNAMTGAVLYLMMFIFYFTSTISYFNRNEYLSYFAIVILLILFVLVAPVFSELFIADLNTYWRLTSWRDNLAAVYSNWGMGTGFGVAYFPNSPEALDAAYKSYLKGSGGYNMYDSLFIRGQHSSIINVFFRMGVLGGGLLLCIILGLLKQASTSAQNNDVRFLTPVFVCGVLNISVHVGFESPPFLITISIAVGMLLGAILLSKRTDQYLSIGSTALNKKRGVKRVQ